MRTEDIKFGMIKAIEENPISDILAEEALVDVIAELKSMDSAAGALAEKHFKQGGDGKTEMLQSIKNVSILLSAADIMKGQPGLLEIFSLAMKEISPAPVASPARDVVTSLIKLDLDGCGNPEWKKACFQAYLED